MSDPTNDRMWVVMADGEMLGVTDSLDIAEEALRDAYYEETGFDRQTMDTRLTFDIKFRDWILFLDRRALWDYRAERTERL